MFCHLIYYARYSTWKVFIFLCCTGSSFVCYPINICISYLTAYIKSDNDKQWQQTGDIIHSLFALLYSSLYLSNEIRMVWINLYLIKWLSFKISGNCCSSSEIQVLYNVVETISQMTVILILIFTNGLRIFLMRFGFNCLFRFYFLLEI